MRNVCIIYVLIREDNLLMTKNDVQTSVVFLLYILNSYLPDIPTSRYALS